METLSKLRMSLFEEIRDLDVTTHMNFILQDIELPIFTILEPCLP